MHKYKMETFPSAPFTACVPCMSNAYPSTLAAFWKGRQLHGFTARFTPWLHENLCFFFSPHPDSTSH